MNFGLSPLRLRTRYAFRLAVIPFALVIAAAAFGDTMESTPGYWAGNTAAATAFLSFIAPFAAVTAAAEGVRHRAVLRGRQAPRRAESRLLWDGTCAPFFVSSCAQLFGLGVMTRESWGSAGSIMFDVVASWAVVIAVHASLGYLIGRIFPLALALPVSILASLVPLTFAWAQPFVPLRYLAGLAMSTCCSASLVLDERAVPTLLVFSAGMLCALLALSCALRGRWERRLLASALSLVLAGGAAAAGISLARDIPSFPLAPRPAAQAHCVGAQPEVCLFREETWRSDPSALIRSATEALASDGFAVPERVYSTELMRDQPGVLVVNADVRLSETDFVRGLASAYVDADERLACYDLARVDDWLESVDRATTAVQMVIGATPFLDDEQASFLHRLQALDTDVRRDVIDAQLAIARDCTQVDSSGGGTP